jgi:hypothetical protein
MQILEEDLESTQTSYVHTGCFNKHSFQNLLFISCVVLNFLGVYLKIKSLIIAAIIGFLILYINGICFGCFFVICSVCSFVYMYFSPFMSFLH